MHPVMYAQYVRSLDEKYRNGFVQSTFVQDNTQRLGSAAIVTLGMELIR
jgi:hypothetical protein